MSFETILFQNFVNQLSYGSEIDMMILCGSYALGTATETSDIDLRIIVFDDCPVSERSIKTIDEYKFSYATFRESQYISLLEQQFANRSKFEARMLSTGTVIYRNEKSVSSAKVFAEKIMLKPFKNMPQAVLNRLRYALRNHYEKVMKISEDSRFFMYNYFCFLRNVLQAYTNILGTEYILEDKLELYFYSEDFRELHQMRNIEDAQFKLLFEAASQTAKKENLQQLYAHIETKIGVISLDNFTF